MPKAELRLHLEGAVEATTFAELAAKHELSLPDHDDPQSLYRYDGLADFLQLHSLVSSSIRDREDFRRVTYECLARCSLTGTRYVELFFSPESHLDMGVTYPTMLNGIIQGQRDAKHDFGIDTALIAAINRKLGPQRAVDLVELVVAHLRPEVIGIGLDCDQAGHPPEQFAEAFRYAAEQGLHRTSREGEVGPAANIGASIEVLGCERVDHGYHIIDDPDLLQVCVDSQITFTVCPTTTTLTTIWPDLADPDHAIRLMADAGLHLTISSDDPSILATELGNEYLLLHDMMGFSLEELTRFALNGLEAAWVDRDTKEEWHRAWSAEIEQLLTQVVQP